MLHRSGCLARQRRLREAMQRDAIDVAVLTLPHHVYWASGYRPHWLQQAAVVVTADGRSLLVSAAPGPGELAVDEIHTFAASLQGTQRQEQPALVAVAVLDWLGPLRTRIVGIDVGAGSVQIARELGPRAREIDPMLWQLRRPKEADELVLMQRAVDCTAAMYQRAREIIEAGVTELQMFTELNAAAVHSAGEPLTALLGNDFACGTGGGAARASQVALAGQLYVLDLGPAYRGYFADNARTFSVDRNPTDAQLKAADAIAAVFPIIETEARPGVSCRALFDRIDRHLRDLLGTGLVHHLGHGVGLEPHEFPHLNPGWNDVLVDGEVFTAEPGAYGAHLGGGIRIENQYLVTESGVRNLLNVPTALV